MSRLNPPKVMCVKLISCPHRLQPHCGWGQCLLEYINREEKNSLFTKSLFRPKNTKKCIFCLFLSLRQTALGWATPMFFASINPTNQRTNPWNVCEQILRIGVAGKRAFFTRPFCLFFFQKKKSNVNNLGFHMSYHFFSKFLWLIWFPAQNNHHILFCTRL